MRSPRHVVLVRVGDFYETLGFDTAMLVQHCASARRTPERALTLSAFARRAEPDGLDPLESRLSLEEPEVDAAQAD